MFHVSAGGPLGGGAVKSFIGDESMDHRNLNGSSHRTYSSSRGGWTVNDMFSYRNIRNSVTGYTHSDDSFSTE